MSIVPSLTPRELLAILLRAGFKILRQKGSHIRLEHPLTKRATTVAMHAQELSSKIIQKFLNRPEFPSENFSSLLENNHIHRLAPPCHLE